MINPEVILYQFLAGRGFEVFPGTTDADLFDVLPCAIFDAGTPERLSNGPWQCAEVSDIEFNVLADDFDGVFDFAGTVLALLDESPGNGSDEVGWISSVEMTLLPTRIPSVSGAPNGIHQMTFTARIVFEQ